MNAGDGALNHLSWSYPATLQNVDRVCAWVGRVLDHFSLAREDRFAVELLLRETLTNAVMHGCAEDPSRVVTGWIRLNAEEVQMEVIDDGRGFAWSQASSQVPDGTSETGRGLAIYRLYATAFQFNAQGNRVTLRRTFRGKGSI